MKKRNLVIVVVFAIILIYILIPTSVSFDIEVKSGKSEVTVKNTGIKPIIYEISSCERHSIFFGELEKRKGRNEVKNISYIFAKICDYKPRKWFLMPGQSLKQEVYINLESLDESKKYGIQFSNHVEEVDIEKLK